MWLDQESSDEDVILGRCGGGKLGGALWLQASLKSESMSQLISEWEEEVAVEEWSESCSDAGLDKEEGTTSQGMRAASKSWEKHRNEHTEDTLILVQWDLCQTSNLRSYITFFFFPRAVLF